MRFTVKPGGIGHTVRTVSPALDMLRSPGTPVVVRGIDARARPICFALAQLIPELAFAWQRGENTSAMIVTGGQQHIAADRQIP
jgi:hypothetical protein